MKPDVYTITAAVVRTPGGPFELEELELEGPRPGEVLIRMVSSGICGTDLEFATLMDLPVVLGHEGAGVVEAVGDGVADLEVGDKVAMSFASCRQCRTCMAGSPAYCEHFWEYNFIGTRPDGSSALSKDGALVGGHFLGQSSFATHAVVRRSSVVKVPDSADLTLVGPFGCGFQTGAGAVLNVLRPAAGSSIAVFGVGGVGAAAIMAAASVGCGIVIAIDIADVRLEQALGFGASHTLRSDSPDLQDRIREIVPGGVDYTIDATGRAEVLRAAVDALAPLGRCGVVGVGPSAEMVLDWRSVLAGRSVTGITAGNSVPENFLPILLEMHAAGRFPVDSLLTTFPFNEINSAVAAVRAGAVGKAVLLMNS